MVNWESLGILKVQERPMYIYVQYWNCIKTMDSPSLLLLFLALLLKKEFTSLYRLQKSIFRIYLTIQYITTLSMTVVS